MVVPMNIITDTIEFIKSLALIDIVFFFAVLALMLLIISLIYFIKENNEEEDTPNKTSNNSNFKNNQENPVISKPKDEITTLKEITEALEEASEPSPINFTKYEEEQEEKAIISYEELLNHKNDFALNYSEEENVDGDLTIKKVDLDNLVNKDAKLKPELNLNVTVLSYEKEEAFLEALRTLQQKLN